MPGWDEVARVEIPVRLATIRTGAPLQPYLKRHPYAFEVQERFMPGWNEVARVAIPARLATSIRKGAPV